MPLHTRYQPFKGTMPTRIKGALVSMETGVVTAYALDALQARGILFVKPVDKVYQGMIVGEHNRYNDLNVNPCKGKKLTNMRAAGKDDSVLLTPVTPMNLEHAIDFIKEDEMVEVTPQSIRLRKATLPANQRKNA